VCRLLLLLLLLWLLMHAGQSAHPANCRPELRLVMPMRLSQDLHLLTRLLQLLLLHCSPQHYINLP
jgi:hypothetical protein